MNNTPIVSIIIPIYNVESYLCQCLDSVISQSFTNWECILVDDGSTDKSGSICDAYAKTDGRFHVIHQENRGSSAARNVALGEAIGRYVFMLDSDDWISINHLSCMLETAEKNNADVVICAYKIEWIGNSEYVSNKPTELSGHSVTIDMFNGKIHAGLWNKLIVRDVIEQNAIRFPKYNYYEDMYFSGILMNYVSTVAYSETATYHYRMNPDSLSNSNDYSKRKRMFLEFIGNMNELFGKMDFWSEPEMVRGFYNHVNGNKLILLNIPLTNETRQLIVNTYPDSISQYKINGIVSLLNYISLKYIVTFPTKIVKVIYKVKKHLKNILLPHTK